SDTWGSANTLDGRKPCERQSNSQPTAPFEPIAFHDPPASGADVSPVRGASRRRRCQRGRDARAVVGGTHSRRATAPQRGGGNRLQKRRPNPETAELHHA